MKYALNLPLALAALFQAWFAGLVLMSGPWAGWSDGPSRGAMALTVLVGGPLGTGRLADEIRSERATSLRYQQDIDEREAVQIADFAQLTDSSPLHNWGAYATDDLDRKERREAALRRLAARPTL